MGGLPDADIAELGKAMLESAGELGAELADRICRDIDFYRSNAVVAKEQVQASCTANMTYVFTSLTGHAEMDVSVAEATGSERAAAGIPLPAVMAAYRVGFRFMWEKTLAEARKRGIRAESILDATSNILVAQDMFTQAMTAAYRQQVTIKILGREEERSALVEALLFHQITDTQSLWEAADILRLPAKGPYVVVAAQVPGVGRSGLPEIASRLDVHDIRSAWRLLPDLQVGIVSLRRPETLRVLIDTLESVATANVGISSQFDDLADTSEALRFARMAGNGNNGSFVSVFDESPLALAAVSAPDAMARIGKNILGQLDELPPEERKILVDTFEAWVEGGGSANETATKIFCHPNTVRHRLHRIEEKTGRSLTRPRDIAELCLAFEIAKRSVPVRG
ncbi:CdaR family transcriptional regulator [Antrihabitans sp. YC2-6]|uniref:PucR family transcriptional regulator n=1 Tax=Antrihabitans sp. YC2-6 TaxID=2799498 RepID=UPI0018F7BE38|nr:helix-turn-helix domain-containing protein [Antrihabitans sp. YC2-6]MBJ8346647.1 helix-turn-helix domain-containing protein [Antrihabitans sp. YC2-6]